jgi:hypothetical protein
MSIHQSSILSRTTVHYILNYTLYCKNKCIYIQHSVMPMVRWLAISYSETPNPGPANSPQDHKTFGPTNSRILAKSYIHVQLHTITCVIQISDQQIPDVMVKTTVLRWSGVWNFTVSVCLLIFKFNPGFFFKVEKGRKRRLEIEKTMKRKQNIGYKTAVKIPRGKNL